MIDISSINFYKLIKQIKRTCYKCSKPLYFHQFMFGFHNKSQREHFTLDMLLEIWENPIFVIECCSCFFSLNFHDEIERIANVIRERRKDIPGEFISW